MWLRSTKGGDIRVILTMKQARLLAGLTQQETADLLDVHKQTYVKWERKPDLIPLGKARNFSKTVERRIDEIFFDTDSTLSRENHSVTI
jgi:DNA-binding XRE family transcriptional regulator